MVVSVGVGVETQMEAAPLNTAALQINLLGPLTISRDGLALPLPASRKVRALLVFLTLSPNAVTRTRLCELLWEVPNDPRGELRWSLSKLRKVLDVSKQSRIKAHDDSISLDLSECLVDALELLEASQTGFEKQDRQRLQRLEGLFLGNFAAGLELDRNPHFGSWLEGQRRRFRGMHAAVLQQILESLPSGSPESFEYFEKWLQLTPFDLRAHEAFLLALLQEGRIQEGEEHLAGTIRAFEAEGLEWLPLREKWRTARRSAPAQAPSVIHAVRTSTPTAPSASADAELRARRASICIMPFVNRTAEGASRGGIADGLTEDIITRLAKLRALFVIARGSVYALAERDIAPDEAGRLLNVDYVASGSVRRQNERINVTVELAEAKSARVVWADEFDCKMDDVLTALDEIGNRIVASIAEEIEATERKRALLKPPSSLDGWEAYHRGLWHMYRFNDEDNSLAAGFFRSAVRLDPTFARAHAALSFTHFQNAFLLRPADRLKEIDLAFDAAGQSLAADDRDPAAHWAMGRALWLRGEQQESLRELQSCVGLSPNFALGHYTLGFVQCQSGDPTAAITSADYSRYLSPFDPLMFAMLASRAIAHVRLGQYEEAAAWALKGAVRPNAHAHILAIAAHCLAMTGRLEESRTFVASIRKNAPDYGEQHFFAAFRFSEDTTALFRRFGTQVGLS